MSFCYYIIDGTTTTENQGMSTGPRILEVPTDFPILSKLKNSEGPFYDIAGLKKNSLIFKSSPSIRKEKMLQERNIFKVANSVLTPKGKSYPKEFINFFLHLTKGDISKGKFSGYHIYDENRCRIVELIKESPNGVWEALIELYDKKTNRWYSKDRSSTFFPKDWTYQKLFEEVQFCIKNKIHVADEQYESYTSCGIKVEIYSKNGVVKTLYPII